MNTLHNWETWIGTDEAGKGDYFGPLVVAAFYVDPACREELAALGIVDGKTLSNQRVRKLATSLHEQYENRIVVVERMPAAYNQLYAEFRERGQNLNHLLASLHAEAMDTLATRVGATQVLVDKFAKSDILTPALRLRKQAESADQGGGAALEIQVQQVTKAERDIAVAAASIVARDAFLTAMDSLSETYRIRLPRGAYRVVDAGKAFVKQHGGDRLGEVAKLHFSLTPRVQGF